MTSQNLNLIQGDSITLIDTISGLDSLIGYFAVMIIAEQDGTSIDTIDGSIDTGDLTATYNILNEDSKLYPIGKHKYEMKIYDTSDHVYTTTGGYFTVKEPLENDPS